MPRHVATGGAGYVAIHLVLPLLDRAAEVTVIDDLRQGHRAAVPPGVELLMRDIGAPLDDVLGRGPWDAVFQFAALSLVGESMAHPMRHMLKNAAASLQLIDGGADPGAGWLRTTTRNPPDPHRCGCPAFGLAIHVVVSIGSTAAATMCGS